MQKKSEENFSIPNTIDNRDRYIQKYLPEYIKPKNYRSFSYQSLKLLKSSLVENIIGVEQLPEGEKLFIAKHNTGDDIWKLLVALDEKVHIVSSDTVHWQDKLLFGAKGVAMKWLEMLPIKENFSDSVISQKDEIIKKAPFLERNAHRAMLDKHRKQSFAKNIKYFRQILAVLLDGQNVEIFVDGPWTRLEGDVRTPYAGYGIIAKMYKKHTGKELNIIPVNFNEKTVLLGRYFNLTGEEAREELQVIAEEKINELVSY